MRPKRFGSLDVASRVEERHPHRLGGLPRVVVLDIELPRDPAPVEPVEDRGPVAEASVRVARRPGHPEHVAGHAAVRRGGEEPIEQDVFVGHVPVEGQVAVVVVAHHRAVHRLAVDRGRPDEAVHSPARVLDPVDAAVMAEVGDRQPAQSERPDARPGAPRDGHAGALGDPVGAWIGAEVVVERVVLLHQHHEVLDRCRRTALGGGGRRAREGQDRGEERSSAHGRTAKTTMAGLSELSPSAVLAGSTSLWTTRPS